MYRSCIQCGTYVHERAMAHIPFATHTYPCIYIYICILVYIYKYIYVYIYTPFAHWVWYTYLSHVPKGMCVYTYTYIHIYIYIYIYIYIPFAHWVWYTYISHVPKGTRALAHYECTCDMTHSWVYQRFVCLVGSSPLFSLLLSLSSSLVVRKVRVSCLIHECGMAHPWVWHGAFNSEPWLRHVCHDSSTCVPWLVYVCAMTHSCVCHDSSSGRWGRRLACGRKCDTTHSYLWRDPPPPHGLVGLGVRHYVIIFVTGLLFHFTHTTAYNCMCVAWFFHVCHITHACVTWFIRVCGVNRTCVSHDHGSALSFKGMRRDSFMCVTWLVQMISICENTLFSKHARHVSFNDVERVLADTHMTRSCVTWFIHVCDMNHSCVWHDHGSALSQRKGTCRYTHVCGLAYIHASIPIWP